MPNLVAICADAINFPYLNEKILNYGYSVALSDDCLLGLADAEKLSARLFPTPTDNRLYLSANTPLRNVSVYDMTGRSVLTAEGMAADGLDVSGFPPGIYVLRADTDTGGFISRFIKE